MRFKKNSSRVVIALGLFLAANTAQSYPGFISYGYATCITCHYNGQGNGPLNDYGRGIFSSEIAARGLVSDETTDETLAERSGILGSTPIPWWFRPGLKYRGLYFVNNPGSQNSIEKYITMQADVSAAIHLDQEQKKVFVVSVGYAATPASQQGTKNSDYKNVISREHYLRWQFGKKLFTYFGLMDKVYGLRIPDHTAYSRAATGVAQNDQAHGIIAQYYGDGWELTGNGFVGNLLQEDEKVRQKGLSGMYEYDLSEKQRIGTSLLYSGNEFVQKTRFAVHSKLGLEKGNSLLTELGVVKDTPVTGADKNMGGYVMLEGTYFLRRGYNLLSQVEYYNATLGSESADMTRWTFGFLMFPMARMELRTTFVNGRSLTDTTVVPDQWMLQTQLHLSL